MLAEETGAGGISSPKRQTQDPPPCYSSRHSADVCDQSSFSHRLSSLRSLGLRKQARLSSNLPVVFVFFGAIPNQRTRMHALIIAALLLSYIQSEFSSASKVSPMSCNMDSSIVGSLLEGSLRTARLASNPLPSAASTDRRRVCRHASDVRPPSSPPTLPCSCISAYYLSEGL